MLDTTYFSIGTEVKFHIRKPCSGDDGMKNDVRDSNSGGGRQHFTDPFITMGQSWRTNRMMECVLH